MLDNSLALALVTGPSSIKKGKDYTTIIRILIKTYSKTMLAKRTFNEVLEEEVGELIALITISVTKKAKKAKAASITMSRPRLRV